MTDARSLVIGGYFRRWGFAKVVLYWAVFLLVVIYLPFHYIILQNCIQGLQHFQDRIPVFLILFLSFTITAIVSAIYGVILIASANKSTVKVKGTSLFYSIGTLLTFTSAGFCVYAIMQIAGESNFPDAVSDAENLSLVIFGLLLGVDVCTWLSNHLQLMHHKRTDSKKLVAELALESKFIASQMFLVDIAVLVGVTFIKAYSHGFTMIMTPENCRPDYSTEHFIVGAIAMHILFSQFIFVILNTDKDISDYRREIVEGTH